MQVLSQSGAAEINLFRNRFSGTRAWANNIELTKNCKKQGLNRQQTEVLMRLINETYLNWNSSQ